jgi:formate--tetrahydrofolate ligase
MKNILDVYKKLQISEELFIPYGHSIAKIDSEKLKSTQIQNKQGHLILVTAMSPTSKGEGKTTTTIGLGDSLSKLGKKTLICLRQPSMGPCFGVKGGATGGGKAMVTPMEKINLNFTGDFHAITSAHNLLAAMIDNHIHWGNELKIDPRRITWKRVLDMNDRALRQITQSLGGPGNGYPREDGFDITVASEVMAILCLSENLQDLQDRIGNIIIGLSTDKKPITAKDLKAHGAMAAILKDAILPNLVQTLEGNPAFVHGGPFANIAHGCNSIIATKSALQMADYVVTEAGFGADLGAEKFLNIKCRKAGIWPSCAVLVTTIRGIIHHGDSLTTGIKNVERHVENLKKFKLQVVVAINEFTGDSESDLQFVIDYCKTKLNVNCVINKSWAMGSAGSEPLGKAVLELCSHPPAEHHFTYPDHLGLFEKFQSIAKQIYRAHDVDADPNTIQKLKDFEAMGYGHLPICVAKTQYSFSSDPKKLGAASNHTIRVREVRLAAGAGFVVFICGDLMTMPGLPKTPAADNIFVDSNGNIQGLF